MCSSDDEYSYDDHIVEYREGEGPSLIKKKTRLICAVVKNHVDVLKELLDSDKWYNVRDSDGYSLLQISILCNNKEVFDYMLSIPDFPLEFVNRDGETALVVSLSGLMSKYLSTEVWMDEHFALELINKGVCFDKICDEGNTPLHYASKRSYINVVKKLISLGVNLNARNDNGKTPLHLAYTSDADDNTEVIATLLTEGAEVSIEDFESSVTENLAAWLQESFFFYSWHDCPEIRFVIIVRLAEAESPLFFEIIKHPSKNIVVTEEKYYDYFRVLCKMNFDYLKTLVDEYGLYLSEALDMYKFSLCTCSQSCKENWAVHISLKKLSLLLNNDSTKSNVIDIISQLNNGIFQELFEKDKYTEKQVTEMYLFLLSYGFSLFESDLQLVYKYFGYCNLFKVMLHMNYEFSPATENKRIICVLIYNLKFGLENLLEFSDQKLCTVIQQNDDLFDFFTHPKLNEIYEKLVSGSLCCRRKDVYMLPSLAELSRNSFRKFFIHKFNIENCRQFYTLLKWFPVNNFLKTIITYERKLYPTELKHSSHCTGFYKK